MEALKEVDALEVDVSFGGDAVNVTALAAAVGGIAARMGDSADAAKMDASAVCRVAEEARRSGGSGGCDCCNCD